MEAHRQERLFLASYWAAVCTIVWFRSSVYLNRFLEGADRVGGDQPREPDFRVRRSGSQQMPGVEGRRRRRLCIP